MTNLTPALDAGRVTDASRPEIAARYKLNDIFCQAWLSHAVTAVARLGIADALGEAPLSAAAIARLTNLDWQAVGRLLRALSANGIFDQIDEGLFAHNSVSRLLRKHEPDSWCGMALMWNHPS